ncbi:MAG TPA: translation initiation factor IF-2, partial [Gemmatimonadales bacterium]|nr:translation initiation factor IF-2 [Gemmatimonadales bacterium]
MAKTRVHDLAAEFGITSEELLSLLREMNVFVRSHLSALEADQVAQVRVRWERDKRKATGEAKVKKGRRKATKKKKAAEPVQEKVTPRRRRRTAADVAEAEAKAAEEEAKRAAAELAALERIPLEEPVVAQEPRSIEERARELFKDLPPLEEEVRAEAPEAEGVAATAAPAEPVAPAEPAAPADAAPPAPPTRRPEPVTRRRVARPTPVRGPKPVFSSSGPPAAPPQRPSTGAGAPSSGRPPAGRRKGRKGRRSAVDQEAVQANILKTLQGMRGGRGKGRGSKSGEPSFRELEEGRLAVEREKEKTRIRVNEFISVAELADIMKIPATQIVQFAFKELGLMVTVNQRLDFDQIDLMASEFGFEAVREDEYAAQTETETPDEEKDLLPRPPVVTIMGHVDHGKTSLLDFIRNANIVAGEAGGITQHIGAYHVDLPGGKDLTFVDTPGHEAFTAMRARGAQVTDIVVLVVAADDQVMPQTVEAISHAKNAGVPIVVAVNKIDLPNANPGKTTQDLLQHSVVLEEYGGDVLSAMISAKTGKGVDQLLEKILLQAELLELKANPNRPASGTVLEATLDPGKGPVATILVQRGTLKVGDDFICGSFSGRVRALLDERGNPVTEAGPSIPVQILGFDGVPAAGDAFLNMADAGEARDIAQKRQRLEREAQNRRTGRGGTLEDISRALQEGAVSQLRIIIKADQGGPAEALADSVAQLSTPEVKVDVVHRGVGAINESDIILAKASGAVVIGFHVRPDSNARAAAEREHVDVRTYRVIYEAVEDVRNALEGLLKPEEKEIVLGEAEVLQLFKVSKVGTVAGCTVRSGVIDRTAKVRVVRDGVSVYEGVIGSL